MESARGKIGYYGIDRFCSQNKFSLILVVFMKQLRSLQNFKNGYEQTTTPITVHIAEVLR